MQLLEFRSLAALRTQAAAWDDLWQRSDVALPTVRCEHLAQWIEQFAPAARLHVLAVESAGKLVAALPLVGRRVARMVVVGALPDGHWASAGDLLLDPQTNVAAALDCLVSGFPQLPWPLLWLEGFPLETPRWQAFRRALERANLDAEVNEQYRVAQIETDGAWSDYEAALSKNLRKNLRKGERQLERLAPLSLDRHHEFQPHEVAALLARALDIEDRGWKGEAGTSVLKSPGMLAYFQRRARLLAETGELELVFLSSGDRPIAFGLGYRAKGTFFYHKIGFDPRFAKYGPGQILFHRQFACYFTEPACRRVDCLGPWTETIGRWATSSYTNGRILIGTGGAIGRCLLQAYRRGRPLVRKIRARATS